MADMEIDHSDGSDLGNSGFDFEGFSEDEVAIQHRGVIRNVEMVQDNLTANDPKIEADCTNGWTIQDTPPTIAPFTKDVKLNAQMPDYDPTTFFKQFINYFVDLLVTHTNLYAH